jgi:hypothetical protein
MELAVSFAVLMLTCRRAPRTLAQAAYWGSFSIEGSPSFSCRASHPHRTAYTRGRRDKIARLSVEERFRFASRL